MARKAKNVVDEEESIELEEPPTSINPYEVLGLEKTATADNVKSAYRKAALKHHPDKAAESDKAAAHLKFQEIALAYAILSDERRRKRYDTTGNTSESLDLEDDDFNWTDFFREQSAAMVDGAMIDKIKKDYQGSEEERDDILQAYEEAEGDMDAIYEQVMCSSVLDDDERFRHIIDEAIKDKTVQAYKAYTKESKASRKQRVAKARAEEGEAMELAEELGVKDKLFGDGSKKKGNDEDALKALIQQRGQSRSDNFLANLEAKYGGGGKKSKRKESDEPPEELFAKNAKKPKAKR
ncbi:putative J domain-containing protein [Cyphellophora attinorum]|uniref:Putative J domain-containing protein n=1 Tax=Cyphellophora attinorum TaxID=1664694 RepID=A0A0N1H211_9EURO|nr:putative J domain-containing protein [Phialophora attinorum]KPI38355.1 putative J domain-containing protein [Phialophora attinorum]